MTQFGWIVAWIVAVLGSIIFAMAIGATNVDFAVAFSDSESIAAQILWDIRVPRVFLASLAGVHFAMAGILLQTVTRNALADPGILGINGGAILFMSIYVVFELNLITSFNVENYTLDLTYLPVVALFGAIIGAALVFILSWDRGISPRRFLLIGIALGSFFHAFAMGLIFGWGPTKQDLLWTWIAGSLYGANWETVSTIAPWTLGLSVATLLCYHKISLLRLDDDSAFARGVNVKLWRIIALLLACCYAGTAVGATGPVGFVGLVVPHIVRKIIKGRLALQFIATSFAGAILVVLSDGLGRAIFAPAEIPIGVITSLIGAPVLFLLLFPLNPALFWRRKNAQN